MDAKLAGRARVVPAASKRSRAMVKAALARGVRAHLEKTGREMGADPEE